MSKPDIIDFADRMNDTLPIIWRYFIKRQTDELSKGRITLPQVLILEFLLRNDELNMKSLADFMEVSTAAITGLVDRLVKNGYIIRIPGVRDRRVIKVKLTLKGSEVIKRINKQRRQMLIDIFGRLSQSERDNYLRIIMRIRDILIKEK